MCGFDNRMLVEHCEECLAPQVVFVSMEDKNIENILAFLVFGNEAKDIFSLG